MYKQPTNKHRVLAMKDKFENRITNNTVQNNAVTLSQSKNNINVIPQRVVLSNNNTTTECTNTNIVPYLPKQMNGSPKRIVKRSEAFRRDKNCSDSNPAFQRNFALRTSYRTKNIDDKIKLFDNNNVEKPLQRSGSFSDLYSTPRRKTHFSKESDSLSIQSTKGVKNEKCDNRIQNTLNESLEDEVNVFQIVDETSIKNLESHMESNSLQETFKDALKKPLPAGPAPSKPPRTFLYSPDKDNKFIENCSVKTINNKPPILSKGTLINKAASKFLKGDPKYMLDKLETALKNNKMKFKRQERFDLSFTSEDEHESGSPKFNTKSNSKLMEPNCSVNLAFEDKSEDTGSILLNGITTFKPDENKTGKKWEPIYAEPFHHDKIENKGKIERTDTKRNSLYYLSSPVVLLNKEQSFDFKD